ncbi:hypothetical protein N7541_003341 [Penicillium brevicompactum]|uniref:Xylanolytic transcriptional activator regulatory domain-containing protein n=1 Tax=Penicillium brevicompactum TaxID=5074 RepID=A0A9W9RLM8_PENBR|nr:hypothetical protein N7541_003341 [Penicillium brevicompactum]
MNRIKKLAQHDTRRKPAAQGYINSLESRISWFETFLRHLKSAPSEERDTMLRELSMDENSPVGLSQSHIPQDTGSLKSGPSGSQTTSQQASRSLSLSTHVDDMEKIRLGRSLGIDSALIQTCLPLFFLYQYPQLMFVYREALLADYFDNTCGGKYWSYALIYAICALGAPHSSDKEVRNKAPLMAKCAKDIIMTYELSNPTPVTIQALLCLAFHEIGQNNTPQGWLFAGEDQSITTLQDIEIRRRIYWGCYVVDKFMSLYLGRPVSLSSNDAAVQPSEPLPDFSVNHKWFGLCDLAITHSTNALSEGPQLVNTLKHTVKLGDIFQEIMTKVFSHRSNIGDLNSFYRLSEMNIHLNRWLHELPEPLQWSQWSAQEKQLQHHIITLQNQHGMVKSPLIMVYALVTTSIALTKLSWNSSLTPQLSFLLKALEECSRVYRIAGEAHSNLRQSLVIVQNGAVRSNGHYISSSNLLPETLATTETAETAGENGVSDSDFQRAPATIFDTGNRDEQPSLSINDSMGDLNWEEITLDMFQMDGDFRGWFSLGSSV